MQRVRISLDLIETDEGLFIVESPDNTDLFICDTSLSAALARLPDVLVALNVAKSSPR